MERRVDNLARFFYQIFYFVQDEKICGYRFSHCAF